jgi:hypothetical protein
MTELPVEILKLLSVNLTREKQILLEHDIKIYARAVNYSIKTILKRNIPNRSRAEEMLNDDIINKFLLKNKDMKSIESYESFGQRFKYNLVTDYVPQKVKVATEHGLQVLERTPKEIRQEFVDQYLRQYVKDVLRTAGAEISAQRKLARVVSSARGKIPHFKEGTLILSGMLIEVTKRVVEVLALTGELIPIPFDKRSRNREIDTLTALEKGEKKFQRVRLILNKEGYLNVDFRITKT